MAPRSAYARAGSGCAQRATNEFSEKLLTRFARATRERHACVWNDGHSDNDGAWVIFSCTATSNVSGANERPPAGSAAPSREWPSCSRSCRAGSSARSRPSRLSERLLARAAAWNRTARVHGQPMSVAAHRRPRVTRHSVIRHAQHNDSSPTFTNGLVDRP
jgi:hypothetical protein